MPKFRTPRSKSSSEVELFRTSAGTERDSLEWVEREDNEKTKAHNAAKNYYNPTRKHKKDRNNQEAQESVIEEEDDGYDDPALYPEERPFKDKPDEEKPTVACFYDNIMLYIIVGYITGLIFLLLWYLVTLNRHGNEFGIKGFILMLIALLLLIINYNQKTRCIGYVLVPTLGNKNGRALLMTMAFLILITGPVLNIIHNIEVMAYSIACGQNLLKNAITPMHEIMGEPVHVVEQLVYICLSQVRKMMERLDVLLLRLAKPIKKLDISYKSCIEWLKYQHTVFDGQMGEPYDRCTGAASISVQECHLKFGNANESCKVGKRFEWFCSNLKQLHSFYNSNFDRQQQIAEQLFLKPLDQFNKLRSIFEVSITFDHSEKSKSDQDAYRKVLDQEIVQHFDSQMHHFLLTFAWLHLVVMVLVVLVVSGSIFFYINYLNNNNFRNYYLTKHFYEHNKYQELSYGYSALPLRALEKTRYVKINSIRLLDFELRIIGQAFAFVLILSLQLYTVCFFDQTLFWMLAIISYHSHQMAELQPPEYIKIVIKNGGFIGDLLRGLVQAFEPLSKNLIVDIQRCLPQPLPPKYLRYWEIVGICIISWILVFTEPYNQRLRHGIMAKFNSHEALNRAEYLHRRILYNREEFIRGARRNARSRNIYYYESWVAKLFKIIRAVLYKLTKGHFGAYKGQNCVTCAAPLRKTDYVRCDTPKCRGVFCTNCFLESNCHCILCSNPSSYGDISDVTEAEDSSDDPDRHPDFCNINYAQYRHPQHPHAGKSL